MKQHKLAARIGLACDYINQQLDNELSVDVLSEVAALSKFHFHRVFMANVGVNVGKYILLARLKRASFRLAFEHEYKIIDVALEAKFDSAEAFSRSFKRIFAMSPSQFRANPNWPAWHAVYNFTQITSKENNMHVEIVNFTPVKIAYVEHVGDPKNVFETAANFIAWRQQTGLSPIATSNTYGIPNGDPNNLGDDEFRFKICGTVNELVPANEFGVENGVLPAMRCAKVRHQGSHDLLESLVYQLYRVWLPQSTETLFEHPVFFHYHNFVHQVDECDLITDIYLPLAAL